MVVLWAAAGCGSALFFRPSQNRLQDGSIAHGQELHAIPAPWLKFVPRLLWGEFGGVLGPKQTCHLVILEDIIPLATGSSCICFLNMEIFAFRYDPTMFPLNLRVVAGIQPDFLANVPANFAQF